MASSENQGTIFDSIRLFAQTQDLRYVLVPLWFHLLHQNEDGDTSLHLAIINCNEQDILTILDVLPKPECFDIYNDLTQTPLHLAVITGQYKIVGKLIDYGASIDLVDQNGQTCVHLAWQCGDLKSLRAIFKPRPTKPELGEKLQEILEMRNFYGLTPLCVAVKAKHFEIVKELFMLGADVNAIDNEPVEQPAGNIEQPAVSVAKPDIESFDDEVCEKHIPWLEWHLNRDVEKVAMFLEVPLAEIEAIKQDESVVETRKIKILNSWRKASLRSGKRPTWENIRSVLENETVGRFDVIRALLNEDEICNKILLWVAHRVATSFQTYACVLGVPDSELEIVSESNERCQDRRFAVLKRWREGTRSPRVEDLIEALEHDIIKENKLAQEMREKFCER